MINNQKHERHLKLPQNHVSPRTLNISLRSLKNFNSLDEGIFQLPDLYQLKSQGQSNGWEWCYTAVEYAIVCPPPTDWRQSGRV